MCWVRFCLEGSFLTHFKKVSCVGYHMVESRSLNGPFVCTLQTLSEDTNSHLKRNVYDNYGQFMATAREIAFLESEMYQLSHMITEQRNILDRMAGTSILGGEKVSFTTVAIIKVIVMAICRLLISCRLRIRARRERRRARRSPTKTTTLTMMKRRRRRTKMRLPRPARTRNCESI